MADDDFTPVPQQEHTPLETTGLSAVEDDAEVGTKSLTVVEAVMKSNESLTWCQALMSPWLLLFLILGEASILSGMNIATMFGIAALPDRTNAFMAMIVAILVWCVPALHITLRGKLDRDHRFGGKVIRVLLLWWIGVPAVFLMGFTICAELRIEFALPGQTALFCTMILPVIFACVTFAIAEFSRTHADLQDEADRRGFANPKTPMVQLKAHLRGFGMHLIVNSIGFLIVAATIAGRNNILLCSSQDARAGVIEKWGLAKWVDEERVAAFLPHAMLGASIAGGLIWQRLFTIMLRREVARYEFGDEAGQKRLLLLFEAFSHYWSFINMYAQRLMVTGVPDLKTQLELVLFLAAFELSKGWFAVGERVVMVRRLQRHLDGAYTPRAQSSVATPLCSLTVQSGPSSFDSASSPPLPCCFGYDSSDAFDIGSVAEKLEQKKVELALALVSTLSHMLLEYIVALASVSTLVIFRDSKVFRSFTPLGARDELQLETLWKMVAVQVAPEIVVDILGCYLLLCNGINLWNFRWSMANHALCDYVLVKIFADLLPCIICLSIGFHSPQC